jgi:hypothetical protein
MNPAAPGIKPSSSSAPSDEETTLLGADQPNSRSEAATFYPEGQLPFKFDFRDIIDSFPFDEPFLLDSPVGLHDLMFQCSLCHQHHSNPKTLKQHLEEHLKDANGPAKHVCHDCSTTFRYLFQLVLHQETARRLAKGEAGEAPCDSCGETFSDLCVINHTTLWIHLVCGANPESSACQKKRAIQDKTLKDQLELQIKEVREMVQLSGTDIASATEFSYENAI